MLLDVIPFRFDDVRDEIHELHPSVVMAWVILNATQMLIEGAERIQRRVAHDNKELCGRHR